MNKASTSFLNIEQIDKTTKAKVADLVNILLTKDLTENYGCVNMLVKELGILVTRREMANTANRESKGNV